MSSCLIYLCLRWSQITNIPSRAGGDAQRYLSAVSANYQRPIPIVRWFAAMTVACLRSFGSSWHGGLRGKRVHLLKTRAGSISGTRPGRLRYAARNAVGRRKREGVWRRREIQMLWMEKKMSGWAKLCCCGRHGDSGALLFICRRIQKQVVIWMASLMIKWSSRSSFTMKEGALHSFILNEGNDLNTSSRFSHNPKPNEAFEQEKAPTLGKTLELKDQTQKLNERLMAADVIMPVWPFCCSASVFQLERCQL